MTGCHSRCSRTAAVGVFPCHDWFASREAALTHANETIGAQSLEALLAGIASTEPAPGSGAAGAVALALGVACARKAIRLSLTHHPDDRLVSADARLSMIGKAALAGADEDARCFAALIAAMQMPKDCDVENEARSTAIRQAAAPLVALAERLVDMSAEIEQIASEIKSAVASEMMGDLIAAAALSRAAGEIQSSNANENRKLASSE